MPGTVWRRSEQRGRAISLIVLAITQRYRSGQLEPSGVLVVKPSRCCRMRDFVINQFARRPKRNGFSLVEMMVVLMVMGLLAGVAVLTLPGDERKLRGEAERFAARTLAARDEAIIGARPISVVVSEQGYYFERRSDGRWQALPGRGFDLMPWDNATTVSAGRQRIVFDSLGLASSDAAVRLGRGDQALVVQIRRDGKVTLDAG
ncbi:MAG: type II secretion system protein GspH [Novosphingobium sp. 32-60-15]|nr:MAG: type II secretion system protein GspH [Novosphingobium sp. 32-60-15]